jgi:hypothetical protein
MRGDDRVRFCDRCNLDVYNLAGMSRGEAETLVRRSAGRLCVRLYRRQDGTVLTRDCPLGLRALRRKAVHAWSRAIAFVAVLLGGTQSCTRRKTDPPPKVLFEMGDVVTPHDPELQMLMGKPKIENAQEVPPPEEPRKR